MTTSLTSTSLAVSTVGVAGGDVYAEFGHCGDGVGVEALGGSVPAERTSIRPSARWRSNPAAICERPALCTQTNITLGASLGQRPRLAGLE